MTLKKKPSGCCILLIIPALVMLLLFVWNWSSKPEYDQFEIGTEGIIQVQTRMGSGADRLQSFAVADRHRLMPCDPFPVDEATIYQVPYGCFKSYIDNNKVLNRLVRVEIRDEAGQPCGQFPIMDDIFQQIATLEHDLFVVRIYDVSGEYFVYVELNVNWWDPCDLYYYDQERHELIQLYELAEKETVGIHIVSTDRLHQLQ